MLYAVFIAVCLVGTPHKDCDQRTAVDWVSAPEAQMGLGGCLLHGEEYAANSRLVTEGKEYIRIFCTATSIGKGNVG